jgi:iron transport multicopper oxidase
VHRADDFTSDDPELNPPMLEGQANPVRRDTVQVPSGASATLRFVADNPGIWFFHCEFHEFHYYLSSSQQLISFQLYV